MVFEDKQIAIEQAQIYANNDVLTKWDENDGCIFTTIDNYVQVFEKEVHGNYSLIDNEEKENESDAD